MCQDAQLASACREHLTADDPVVLGQRPQLAPAACVLLHVLCRHGDFVARYKILLPREQQDIVLASEKQTRAAVLHLLSVFKVPEGQYEMGRTKVFFKPGVWCWLLLLLLLLHTV